MKRTGLVAAATALLASSAVVVGFAGPSSAASPDLKIDELRLLGPMSATQTQDEFVEIVNPTDSAVTVSVDDGSSGWALVASDGTARFVIPNGTVIPPRGHYLGANSVGYSLSAYPGGGANTIADATWTTDIPLNAGVALFRTSNPANFTLANRSDAVGSTTEANALYKEGAGYAALNPAIPVEGSLRRHAPSGTPVDSDDNAADFLWSDTNGTSNGGQQHLGAPGPQNLASPVQQNGSLPITVIDPLVGPYAVPNAVRDFTSIPAQNSTNGTIELRRRITNNTGAPLTRLRLRIDDLSTFPEPAGTADLRARMSVMVPSIPLTGGGATGAVGTFVETPPNQPNGGGLGSTITVPTVNPGTPLAPGASVDVALLFGVQSIGTYEIHLSAEALPANGTSGADAVMACNTEGCGNPPVASGDTSGINEDTQLNVFAPGVLGNDSDPDGDGLHAVLEDDVTHGNLTLNPDGSFVYDPDPGYHGPDQFSYHANDGTSSSNKVNVDITVNDVNDPPVAVGDGYSTAEDTPLTVPNNGVLGNDSDPDGDALTAVLDTNAAHGQVVLDPLGGFTYTPNPNENGPDSFTYHAHDTAGGDSPPVVVTIDVTPANDAPTASDDGFATDEDTPLTVPANGVLGNDSDVDGDGITAVLDANATHGQVALAADGGFTYTPNADYNGPDSFTYHANDGTVDGNIATVNLTVGPVQDAPVATPDQYDVTEDTPLTVPVTGVLANDSDPDGDAITAVIDVNAAHGQVDLAADGSFTYTPSPNYRGPDSFSYHANDGGLDSFVVVVSLNVISVNDAPVAADDAYSTSEDTGLVVPVLSGVLANDTDVDGDTLVATVDLLPAHGGLALDGNGSFVYTPLANFNGVDTFTYHVNDGALDSEIVTVTIVVTAVNDAPVANPDAYNGTEDTALVVPVSTGLVANDVDVDGNPVTVVIDATPTHGTLTPNGNGSFTYTPLVNVHGVDTFTYHLTDGTLTSNTVTVTITVAPVNDPPTANPDVADSTTAGDQLVVNVLGNDGDVDGDTVTIVSATDGAQGAVQCSTTSCTYTPYLTADGSDTFTYTITDGNGATAVGTVQVRSLAQQILQGPVTTVPYTAPQSGPLPQTGSNTIPLVILGFGLTVAGAVTLRLRRRLAD